jgi:hypothetical protein
MSRCLCGKPKPPHALKCVVCRHGVTLKPGRKHESPCEKAQLARVLRERAA